MHDPAACGALPAQHAKVHIGPLANVESGKLLARTASNTVAPSSALATRIGLDSQCDLVRAIMIRSCVERFCHCSEKLASNAMLRFS